MKKITLFFTLVAFSISSVAIANGPEMLLSPLITLYIKWKEGEAHKYYTVDSEILYRAVKKSLHELNISVDKDNPPKDGEFYLITGSNNRFKIKVKKIEKNISKLSIRVNFMGDKPLAEIVYKNTDRNISVIEFDTNGQPTPKN